jgi:hypothetical protein
MKQKEICEICRSIDLVRKYDVFENLICSVKCSTEESKKDIDEDFIKIDDSKNLTNLKKLLDEAIATLNLDDVKKYSNKLVELEPKYYKAVLYKEISKELDPNINSILSETESVEKGLNETLAIIKEENITDLLFLEDIAFKTSLFAITATLDATESVKTLTHYELKRILKSIYHLWNFVISIHDTYDESMQKCDKIDYDIFKKNYKFACKKKEALKKIIRA